MSPINPHEQGESLEYRELDASKEACPDLTERGEAECLPRLNQSREPNDRDLYTRVAALEYQLTEIQNTQAQLRATMAPGGYVTDAFERVVDRIDDVEDNLNSRIDEGFNELNGKIDIILRSVTGMRNSEP